MTVLAVCLVWFLFLHFSISLVGREVSVANWVQLNIVIEVVGWIYFVAWSISFYPQVSLSPYFLSAPVDNSQLQA